MAGKLVGRALSNTANVTLQSITVGNSTSNSVINSTAVVTPSVNVGSNVFVNTSTIHIGNSTVNTTIKAGNVDLRGTQLTIDNISINGTQIVVGNSTVNAVINSSSVTTTGGATFGGHLMPSANITYDIGNSSMRWRDLWLSGTTINLGGATIKTDTDTGAVAIIPKPTTDTPDPLAVVISPAGGVTAVPTTGGVPAANAIADAATSNVAAAVPIDIVTTPPANGQMLVWSNTANTFIAHSTIASVNVVGTATLKTLSANGHTGSNGQLLASNGTATYWTDPPAAVVMSNVASAVPNTTNSANASYIAEGELFINTIDELLYSSNGSGYFVVGSSAESGITVTTQTFTGNGSAVAYTLNKPTTNVETFVFLNGVAQVPGTDYSISGTTLTFVTPPPSDNEIEVRILDIADINGVDITLSSLVGNGSNTAFTLSTSLGSNSTTFVYLNGVAQVPTVDYGVNAATLTFTTAPANGELIRAVTISAIGDYTSDSFTANSTVNNNFVLSTPTVTTKAVVFINGVAQAPSVDYYVSGNNLVLINNAAANDVVQVRSFYEEPSAGGANTTIQYNSSGLLKGFDGLTFNETTNNVVIANTLSVAQVRFTASYPPIGPTAPGIAGTIAWDTNYIYMCIGTNTWKRIPMSTWTPS